MRGALYSGGTLQIQYTMNVAQHFLKMYKIINVIWKQNKYKIVEQLSQTTFHVFWASFQIFVYINKRSRVEKKLVQCLPILFHSRNVTRNICKILIFQTKPLEHCKKNRRKKRASIHTQTIFMLFNIKI